MSATAFTLDDLTLEYSQEDYKPSRREARTGAWYEFRVSNAICEQNNAGLLRTVIDAEALDGSGKNMFKKKMFLTMPISLGENAAPSYSKGLWLMNMATLCPDHLAYDRVEKDPLTEKTAYFKGDVQLQGKEYEEAMVSQNKAVAEKAREIAKQWIESGDGMVVEDLVGKTFFAKLISSKDGKYVNIDRPFPNVPMGEEVIYDRKVAMGDS